MIREIEGIKEFLSFLRKAGVESSVFYVLGNRPAVAVPKTAKINNPSLKVESGIFEDEDGERLEMLIVSPSPELKEEWEKLWKRYRNAMVVDMVIDDDHLWEKSIEEV